MRCVVARFADDDSFSRAGGEIGRCAFADHSFREEVPSFLNVEYSLFFFIYSFRAVPWSKFFFTTTLSHPPSPHYYQSG